MRQTPSKGFLKLHDAVVAAIDHAQKIYGGHGWYHSDVTDHLYTAGARMADAPADLDFETLRQTNVKRCNTAFHPLDSWSPEQWSNAMAGEVGEACNITKKMGRGDYPDQYAKADAIRELGKEIADVVIYADLLAARMGINLGEAVREKFNEVSDRRKSPIKL